MFANIKSVDIDKRGTWTALDVIQDRVVQFSNADRVKLQYKVYEESIIGIRRGIPHNEYRYEKAKHNRTQRVGLLNVEYNKEDGNTILIVKKFV